MTTGERQMPDRETTRVEVWAPYAREVEAICDGRPRGLAAKRGGWWSADVRGVGHGSDYAFRIDGSDPLPDPRSPWQPAGVHGPSRWVDHARYKWNDGAWQPPPLESALIYELHVGTFTTEGTFAAAETRLDYLARLGVTHIELMPVAEFSGDRGWGYDGVDLYAPHHAYGGPEALKHLVDACHARGLAVLLDVVYNHLGPAGNYLDRFGPYFTDKYRTPWGEAVNLDGPDSNEVRRFIVDNALMWLRDYHFDGLRIDAVHAIVDISAIHILEQLAAEVGALEHRLGRTLVLIAESDLNDPRIVRPPEVGGYGMHAQWNEDFHHALHTLLTGERAGYYADFGEFDDVEKALREAFVYDGRFSSFRRRNHGRPAADLPGSRFVGCLQNHDQIGNRALGERTSHLLTPGLLKVGGAMVLTAPFIPMLFQGEEWGASTPFLYFTDHREPALADAVRRGRREEFAAFGWDPESVPDPQAEETFLRSKLRWDELEREPHASLLAWYRSLIRLRREWAVLADGRMEGSRVSFDRDERWLAVNRGPLLVICNLSESSHVVSYADAAAKAVGQPRLLLAGEAGASAGADHATVPAQSAIVVDLGPAAVERESPQTTPGETKP